MTSVDSKVHTLWENYRDNAIVRELSDDVNTIRRRAALVGAGATGALLVVNETARFAFRSPLFKLNPINAVAVLAAPTLLATYAYNQDIDDKVSSLWKIHENRQLKGLGGTYQPSGLYPEKNLGNAMTDQYGTQISFDEIMNGTKHDIVFNNALVNWSHDIQDHPMFFEDNDRETVPFHLSNFERNKASQPAEGSVIGEWYNDPPQDKDDKFREAGIDGDHLGGDPADSNLGPAVDHRIDEEFIWNFPISYYNQFIVENEWMSNPTKASERRYLPFWALKLEAFDYNTPEKVENAMFQWGLKVGLENLKIKHANMAKEYKITDEIRNKMTRQIQDYIEDAYDQLRARQMGDVSVTDRKPRDQKFATLNSGDDQEFFEYKKAVEEYNSDATSVRKKSQPLTVDELLEDLPGSVKLQDGSDFLVVTEDDISSEQERDAMYEKILEMEEEVGEVEEKDEDDEDDDDDEDEYNALKGYDPEDEYWQDLLKEKSYTTRAIEMMNVFEENEQYDAVKDMQTAFKSTAVPLKDQLIQSLPEHVFMDIKTPLGKQNHVHINPHNAMKPIQHRSFFDYLDQQEYFQRKKKQENLRNHLPVKRSL